MVSEDIWCKSQLQAWTDCNCTFRAAHTDCSLLFLVSDFSAADAVRYSGLQKHGGIQLIQWLHDSGEQRSSKARTWESEWRWANGCVFCASNWPGYGRCHLGQHHTAGPAWKAVPAFCFCGCGVVFDTVCVFVCASAFF